MELAAAVAPTTLARQRTLPVADPLRPLLPDGGLTRGRVVACRGVAATSLTLALAIEATRAGAWLAVVDVPWLGVEAASELGVPLERVVRVEPGDADVSRATVRGSESSSERGNRQRRASERASSAGSWADLVAAVLDGFELVVTRVPRRVDAGVLRRVRSRVQARESVLLAVGDPGPLTADLVMDASAPVWEGVDDGAGHLRGRRVTVVSSGRRIPRSRRADLWLPGPDGVLAAVGSVSPAAEPLLRSVG